MLRRIALAGLVFLGACATSSIAAPGEGRRDDIGRAQHIITNPLCDWSAAHPSPPAELANPDLRRVYRPRSRICNVDDMTIAVRNDGEIRPVYGDHEAPLNDDGRAEYSDTRIDEVIDLLVDRARPGEPLRMLIYAHGGLVSHTAAVRSAEQLAPAMVADGYAPIFLVWNSDLAVTYADRLCCVRDGRDDNLGTVWFAPTRAIADVGAGLSQALENYGRQWVRYADTAWDADNPRYNVPLCRKIAPASIPASPADTPQTCYGVRRPGQANAAERRVVLPFAAASPTDAHRLINDRSTTPASQRARYVAFYPARPFTTGGAGAGASAWNNMVRRTRIAFTGSSDNPRAPKPSGNGPDTCVSARAGTSAAGNRVGGFTELFEQLVCERKPNGRLNDTDVRITLVGHSMGALVANELLYRFPDLPYERVVYMAAASPLRDFQRAATPVLASPKRDVEFYNLTLHPYAESREMYAYGAVPQGSLLEWVDEMFEGPRTPDERMMGKWNNIRNSPTLAQGVDGARMNVRVFANQHTMLEDAQACARFHAECVDDVAPPPGGDREPLLRCHPVGHGEFNHYTFWRDRYLSGEFAGPSAPPRPGVCSTL